MSTNKTTASARGLLFDMDGTLLDSTPAVLATWEYFAKQYNLDLTEVLRTAHGVRTRDNMKRWCGITDEKALDESTELFESMIVTEGKRLQQEGKSGLVILPGVASLLGSLESKDAPVWAIVTSATTTYAAAALPTAGVQQPPHLITANHVTKGKPHPEPYLTGAKALDIDVTKCIVFEDAPSGIKSGVASGAKVLAVCTSHPREELEGLGATWIVQDLSRVHAQLDKEGNVLLEIDTSA